MIKNGTNYNCSASADGYKNPESPKRVTIGGENDIFIGIRPEFIFAKQNNTLGSNSHYTNKIPDIPQGEYYVIATGGGRSWSNKH